MYSSYLVNKTNLVNNLFLVYLSIPKCFGQPCVNHQEKHLCLCDTWNLLFCVDDCLVCRAKWKSCFIQPCIPDSHPNRITSTKCCTNTVVSPDDGHVVAWSMYRLINILRINCAPSWFYLQDYTDMHGQQNKKLQFISLAMFSTTNPFSKPLICIETLAQYCEFTINIFSYVFHNKPFQ